MTSQPDRAESSTAHLPSGFTDTPRAEKRPVETTTHGDVRVDEYHWLRDKTDAQVLDHLRAENAFTEASLAHLAPLREELFNEFKSRILETDLSVPIGKGPWEYYSRTVEGQQYGIHCRRPRRADTNDASTESVLLDENQLAEGHEYFAIGTFEVSPDHNLLAYAFDTAGDEFYELRIRDLRSGTELPDNVEGTSPGVAWSGDNSVLFYLVADDNTRPFQLWRHALGTSQSDDVLVHEELDERFFLGLGVSATDDYIVLTIGSQVTTEQRTLRADDPHGQWTVFAERHQDVEYSVDHHVAENGTERWFVITNDGAENFRIAIQENGYTLQPAVFADGGPLTDPEAKLDGLDLFRNHLVLYERKDAMERIRIVELDHAGAPVAQRVMTHADAVHTVWGGGNVEFDSPTLRFGYMSMTTPPGTYSEVLRTGERTLLKQLPVLGDFDSTRYVSERVWATAGDGTRIPMSVVRHRDTPLDGTAPGVLYGYGSYEISTDPTFSVMRLSLLDRGFVFALAHVRGGGELGRHWYLAGKYLQKRNTFTDFIACGEHLVNEKYVAPNRLAARGGSAGGLLMGAVLNMAPTRWRVIVAEVPFVDSLNTMLDDSLPLTEIEKEEWGDPSDPEFYAYMKSYAPYENIAPGAVPAVLATGGLNDPRVGFHEPAKWVQRLRDRAISGGPIVLKTEMGAGHGGPSGRYDSWRDEAFVLAFIVGYTE